VTRKFGFVSLIEHLSGPLNFFGIFSNFPSTARRFYIKIWKALSLADELSSFAFVEILAGVIPILVIEFALNI